MRFLEYLLEVVNVTVDPEDPEGSIQRAKEQLKNISANPQRAIKQREVELKGREADIAQEEDPDIKKRKEEIRRGEERITKQQMELEAEKKRKEQERARAAGFAGGVVK